MFLGTTFSSLVYSIIHNDKVEDKKIVDEVGNLPVKEVEEALGKMKRNRVTRVDEVTVNFIVATGEIGVHWLYRMINTIWNEARTPSD